VDTVFNFTPRTGFCSIGVGELTTVAMTAYAPRREPFLLDLAFGIPVLPYSGGLPSSSCICGDRQERAAGV
jgi:hypothetical protein